MPTLAMASEDGGVGFDYRFAMGIADQWIRLTKDVPDEDWHPGAIWHELTNRRPHEKSISYAECHDQALVGDKTLAFWLMDKEMYWHMHKDDDNLVIERGMALHKMIRLFTIPLGGQAYMNFMGNEFGHPEWIDFPREGNNWSYLHARRQWSLVDNPKLKYQYLAAFDRAMIDMMKEHQVMTSLFANQLNMDEANKTIVFERKNLVFVFNFHPSDSIFEYILPVPQAGEYSIILNSDDLRFGGHGRIDNSVPFVSFIGPDMRESIKIYNTNRTALVLKRRV
jgi:1,4-alpha-glucan branching enzyme